MSPKVTAVLGQRHAQNKDLKRVAWTPVRGDAL